MSVEIAWELKRTRVRHVVMQAEELISKEARIIHIKLIFLITRCTRCDIHSLFNNSLRLYKRNDDCNGVWICHLN